MNNAQTGQIVTYNTIFSYRGKYVGLLMMGAVKSIDWDNFKVSVPAFLTLAVMPFTYNISYKIAYVLISYIIISVFCGDIKKIKVSSRIIAFLFIAMLVLTH
ncbi:MAG: hypothetical protein IJO68_08405 [Clostridia bacterium]|nr:hypothetical protein [Clostridia bacterium]